MTKKRIIYLILLAVFSALFVFSAVNLVITYFDYRKADQMYADIQTDYVIETVVPPESTLDEDPVQAPPQAVVPVSIDFDKLQKTNRDVVGWLYCEDSVINYPVMQAADNETYLHKDLNGEYLRSGTLFVDYRNQKPLMDPNYIIYGHSMRNGSMFGMLLQYKKQSYFDEHPVMYYLTPEGDYRIELFAGQVVKTDSMVYQTTPDSDGFAEYVQTMRKNSTFQSDITVTEQDTIVTLSTCSYEFENARYVVLGKLIPIE